MKNHPYTLRRVPGIGYLASCDRCPWEQHHQFAAAVTKSAREHATRCPNRERPTR